MPSVAKKEEIAITVDLSMDPIGQIKQTATNKVRNLEKRKK